MTWRSNCAASCRISREQRNMTTTMDLCTLRHTYRDPSSEFKYKIVIKDTRKQTTVWTVIGVDEDNWWNEYAPGKDCMKEFAPRPYYDPTTQGNVLRAGKQVDDAMCSYLFDVTRTAEPQLGDFHRCGGPWEEFMAGSSDRRELRKDQLYWGEVVQKIARRAASWGTQVIVEVPPEAQLHGTKQYKMLSDDDVWTSTKIDGCTHGQRSLIPGPGCIRTHGHCKTTWEHFAANVTLPTKSSDTCVFVLMTCLLMPTLV